MVGHSAFKDTKKKRNLWHIKETETRKGKGKRTLRFHDQKLGLSIATDLYFKTIPRVIRGERTESFTVSEHGNKTLVVCIDTDQES